MAVYNSSATSAATFRLRGYKCMLVMFVSQIHRTLTSVDYRIFNVHMLLCVRIHMGVWHTDNESAQHFDLEKLTNFHVLCSPESIGSRGRHSTNHVP